MLDDSPADTYRAFCELTLPKPKWTHEAHLTVCWMTLRNRDASAALEFLRGAIRSYNVATGVENTATNGYHETLTKYYVDVVAALEAPTVSDVLAAPECERTAPLRHWSADLLFSPEARARWVEPDLSPLAALACSAAGDVAQT